MWIKALASGVVLATVLGGFSGRAHAEEGGIVQGATKAAAKGAVKGVQQQLSPGELVNRAKDLTKGVAEGIADTAPLVTSQILNQASVNRKAIGHVARQASREAVAGALDATVREVEQALGRNADGPLAVALTAMTERAVTAAARGVISEIHLDPVMTEKLTAAAVRGAVSELHSPVRLWPFVLAFTLGGVSTFLCALGLMLLYLLFERKRPLVSESPFPARLEPSRGG